MTRAQHPYGARACHADQCAQGRTPCPCPQACELPDWAPPTTTAQRIATSLLAHAAFVALTLAALVCVVILAPSA